eukprot:TRINITY_DN10146_c0_g1_i2.p1 TRINITY_DN10146_c0_g1~~TRINITY_DN10146_c0_g1_i2.p1  ORF type:complete len:233 (+),score=36.11 TRINITY_DN10146_c0_g1_i2:138-836(+)
MCIRDSSTTMRVPFEKITKFQIAIAFVTALGAVIIFGFGFAQMSTDDKCAQWSDGSIVGEALGEYVNPYSVSRGSNTVDCGWPDANTAFRSVVLVCVMGTVVLHALTDFNVIGNDCTTSMITPLYFLWMISLFASFCVDSSCIRTGAGFCSDVYEGKREQSCHSGKYIGLAFGEVLLCILLYVLYKVPRTSSNIGEGEVETTRRDLVLPGYDQESAEENANPWNQPPAKLES